jgi:tape measure domain-containing protein
LAEGTSLGTAWIDVVPSFRGLKKQIASEFGSGDVTAALTGATESWGSQIGQSLSKHIGGALSSIGKIGLGGVAAAVGGVTAALTAQIPAAIAASDATDKFKKTLEFAGVDPSRIKQLTAAAQTYADQTVYDLSDIQSVTAQLAANGVKDFDKMAEAAGNVNAIAGGTKDTFKQVALALVQINGAGKLTTQDWNQIAAAIPGASGKLQEALKNNAAFTGNFRDAMSQGQITAEEFNQALMDLGFTDVAEQAAKSASTFEGAWGNLEAAVEKGLVASLDKVKEPLTDIVNAVGEQLGPAFDSAGKYVDILAGKIKPFADAMKDGNLTLEDIAKALGQATGGFAALAGAGTLLADPSLIIGAFDALPQPSAIVGRFSGLMHGIGPKMGEALAGAAGPLGSAAEGLIGKVGMFLNPARFGKVLAFGGLIAAAVAGIGALVQASGGELTTQIQTVISDMILNVSKYGAELVSNAPQLIASGAEAVKTLITGITDALPVLLDMAGQIIESFVSAFGSWLPQLIPAAAQMIVALVTGLVAMLPQLINAGVDLINGLAAGLTAAIPVLLEALPGIITSLLGALTTAVPQLIQAGAGLLTGLINGIVQAIPTLAAALPQIVTTLVTTLVEALPQLINAGVEVLNALITGLQTALPVLIEMLPQILTTVVTTIVENLPLIIEAGISLLTTLINGILQALPQLIDMLPTIINTIVTTLVTNLPMIISAGVQLLIGLINGIVQAIPQLIAMLPQIITTIVTVLVQNIPLILSAGVQILTGLIDGIVKTLPALKNIFLDVPKQITSVLANVPSMMVSSGKKIIQGLIDGIKSMASSVTGAVSDMLGSVRKYLPFSPAKKGPFSGHGWTLYSGRSIVEALAEGAAQRAPLFEAAIRDTIAAGQEQLAGLEAGALSVTAGLGGTAGLARIQATGPQYLVVRDSDDQLIGRMRVEAGGVVSDSLAPASRSALRERIGF